MEHELLESLPEEMREEIARRIEERKVRIATLTTNLAEKRKKDVEWRANIGIEQEWLDCEDAYEGIDDANRGTERTAGLSKNRIEAGGTSRQSGGTRSTVFINITRPYTDAAAARVADMLLPTDDRNFSIQPTPVPEFGEMEKDESPIPQAVAASFGVAGAQTVAQAVKMHTDKMKERAERAQTRIEDWLIECQYHAEVRRVIEDCAKLGTGVLKGPVPTKRDYRSVHRENGEITLKTEQKIAPESVRVDPWDIFPDKSCGDDIKNGSHIWERDRLSAKQLRELKDMEGYIAEEIEVALKEGPGKKFTSTDNDRIQDDDRFEVWYFTGAISVDEFKSVNAQGDVSGDHVNVVCTLVNDRLIKVARSHLNSGEFPYDLIPWQRRSGMPFGIGVDKQINVAQRFLNAAARNMADNAALSSGPQIVMKKGVVRPVDGSYVLTPLKQWICDSDADVKDVRMAFMAIDIPTRQSDLMAIIQFAMKIAEDTTGLPMMMQGNQGEAPDTVGGMTMLNNNANTVLRRIARLFDDCITEPHIRRYYEWLMTYGEEEEKGDYTIDARGSTSLVDRDIQQRAIMSMGPMVLDERFGADPELWFAEALKANKIDPKRIMLTDDKKEERKRAAMQQQMAMLQNAQQQEQQRIAADREKLQAQVEMNRDDNLTRLQIAQ